MRMSVKGDPEMRIMNDGFRTRRGQTRPAYGGKEFAYYETVWRCLGAIVSSESRR